MKAFKIQKITGSLLVAMALTTGCSKSQVPANDKATAGGQAGGVDTNRLGATAPTLEAVSLPNGLSMSLVEIPENEARQTVSNIVSGLPKKSTYAGSFKVNGSGSLNGQTVIVALGFTKLELQFPAAPELILPVTVSLFDGRTVAASLGLTSQISTVSVLMACVGIVCGGEVTAKPAPTGSPAASGAPTPNICATADSVVAFLEGCMKSESAAICQGRLVGRCGGDNVWFQENSKSAQPGNRMGCTVTCSNGEKCEVTTVAGVDPDPTAACNRIEVALQAKDGKGFTRFWDIEAHKTSKDGEAGCEACHFKKDGKPGWDLVEVGSDLNDPLVGPTFSFEACTKIKELGPKDCKSPQPASKEMCESFDAIFSACLHAATPTLDLSNPSPSPSPSSSSSTTGP